jgi:hypothetical protein
MSRLVRCVAASLLITISLCAGCTKTRALWIADYELGADPVLRPAPESGVYKVKWAIAREGRSFGINETMRVVREGEPIGFGTDEGGRVFALAGHYQMPLELHPQARFCVWSCKREVPSGFARAIDELGDAAIRATASLPFALLEASIDSLLDDDDDDDDCDDADDRDEDDDRPSPPKDRGERYERKRTLFESSKNH